eukprot:CAMPEP_0116913436 /NCGR_PEP_ID=MMETSP0467-20121206/16702_1 /TAXON_ID=283647 /ORGANISM="Mesodinium pulex, Strain SPMC105" /LENGTH=34 /DNA_ID= /DNA_START= /DNA_END= /DNA_ORIENTATION=
MRDVNGIVVEQNEQIDRIKGSMDDNTDKTRNLNL